MLKPTFIISIIIVILSSCNHFHQSTNAESKYVAKKDNSYILDDSTVVSLKGILHYRTFYGPSGYGETPKLDKKEKCTVLDINEPITGNFGKKDTSNVGPVSQIQLVILDDSLWAKYGRTQIGKHVVAKGTLFEAETGHHHTPIMMTVKE